MVAMCVFALCRGQKGLVRLSMLQDSVIECVNSVFLFK
jgi:hypothetical protein